MSINTEILRVIESSTIPISTPDLIAIFGLGYRHPRQQLWNRLRWLEQQGLVRKSRQRRGRPTFWRAV